jgi:ABC-type uncharacterized transport system substrate-binding protein
MKKVLLAFAAMMVMAACGNEQTNAPEGNVANEVTFEVAKNYFFKKGSDVLPEGQKITSEEAFNNLFGMATTMGKDGKPTPIDFSKQFVLAIVLPVTDFSTEINPVKLEEKGNSLLYSYKVKKGEKQTFNMQPVSIIVIDKKYENKEVVLVNDGE